MKIQAYKNHNELLDGIKLDLKEKIFSQNEYSFQIKDRRVKVVFSDNPNASTIENALVKIAIKRIC